MLLIETNNCKVHAAVKFTSLKSQMELFVVAAFRGNSRPANSFPPPGRTTRDIWSAAQKALVFILSLLLLLLVWLLIGYVSKYLAANQQCLTIRFDRTSFLNCAISSLARSFYEAESERRRKNPHRRLSSFLLGLSD